MGGFRLSLALTLLSFGLFGGCAKLSLEGITLSKIDELPLPPSITYSPSSLSVIRNLPISTPPASNSGGSITSCSVDPALPSGLTLDPFTCAISGSASTLQSATVYIITASNTEGSSSASLTLSVAQAEPLVVTPAFSTIHPARVSTVSLTSTGGAGAVTYGITSGTGSIGSATGDYSVDTSVPAGKTIIRATDSANPAQTSNATVYQIASRFNGSVSAIAVHNGYGYFSGSFTAYNPNLMNGIGKFDAATGDLASGCNFAGLLNPGAEVKAIAETSTSIYLGGSFISYAGTTVQNLIKVNKSTCALDTTFTQSSGASGTVSALAVSGPSLYLGGLFTTYRGATAQRLAKVDLTSGDLDTTFTQSTGTNSTVNALSVSGSSLYVGGGFTTYRGAAAQRLAKVDLNSGALDSNFTQSTGASSSVRALAVSGSSLYVGGNFNQYRGAPAQLLAKVDLNSGDLDTTFTQSSGVSGGSAVRALAVSGSSLYLGGSFGTYRGAPANYLAKVDLNSGDLDTTFTQSTGAEDVVYALAVSGSSLYLGGSIWTYRGAPAQNLAKVDLNSGDLDTTFHSMEGDGMVYAVAVSGSSLVVGGDFRTSRGAPAQGLAKVDLTSGALDTTFTQSSGTGWVSALAVSGSSLYFGGYFTTYRGAAAQNLAKVDLNSGALDTTFTQSTGANNVVRTLAVSGSSLVVGGDFTTYRGAAAERLAKVDLNSGDLDTTFTQATGASNSVHALAVSGSSLVVGGDFTTYRGAAAQRLAKVDLTSGDLDTTFTQSTGASGAVYTLAVSGSSLYLGGSVWTYRGAPARYLAKVDLNSGALDTTFTQSTGASAMISALAVSGSSLYVGGSFIAYRGAAAERLAKVDLNSGDLDTTFTQSTGANIAVSALAVSGSSLYVGGSFTTYRGTAIENAAPYCISVDLTTGDRGAF